MLILETSHIKVCWKFYICIQLSKSYSPKRMIFVFVNVVYCKQQQLGPMHYNGQTCGKSLVGVNLISSEPQVLRSW